MSTDERLRILIVDDDRRVANAIGELLDSAARDIEIVYSAGLAVRMCPDFQPQVIVLGVHSPELVCFQVLDQLLAQLWAAQAIFIAYTGSTDRHMVAEGGHSGFRFYVDSGNIHDLEGMINSVSAS